MQCKDIPDLPILQFLTTVRSLGATFFDGSPCSISQAMPPGTPEKLMRAKAEMLRRRGLVDGCMCGCRGDVTLTDKGREYLVERGLV